MSSGKGGRRRERPNWDRQQTRQVAVEILRGLGGEPKATDAARRLIAQLSVLESKGEFWAFAAKCELGVDGATKFMRDVLAEEKIPVVAVGHNGEVLTVPVRQRLARREYDGDGKPVDGWTYPLWVYEPWDTLVNARAQMARREATFRDMVAAIDRVLELRVLYPSAATPFEACRLAGIDPFAFGIDLEKLA
jgi:hypothetical protein